MNRKRTIEITGKQPDTDQKTKKKIGRPLIYAKYIGVKLSKEDWEFVSKLDKSPTRAMRNVIKIARQSTLKENN